MVKIMYAWKDLRPENRDTDNNIRFIYSSESLVRMCFPDGAREQEKLGEGKVIKVEIREV